RQIPRRAGENARLRDEAVLGRMNRSFPSTGYPHLCYPNHLCGFPLCNSVSSVVRFLNLRWNFREADPEKARALQESIAPLLGSTAASDDAIRATIAKLLVLRGIDTPETACAFLSPSIDQLH